MNGPLDVQAFLADDFSAKDYANSIIEGRSAQRDGPAGTPRSAANGHAATGQTASWRSSLGTTSKSNAVEGDVAAALSRLNVALDDVGRQIKEEVSTNSRTLIKSAQGTIATEQKVSALCQEVANLQSTVQDMKKKVATDHALLQKLDSRLLKLQVASEMLREAQNFVLLCRRLQLQMQTLSAHAVADGSRMEQVAEEEEETGQAPESVQESAGELPHAAATIKAIEDKVESAQSRKDPQNSFIRLAFVHAEIQRLGGIRQTIADRMEDLIVQGLRELSPSLLNQSLQTALNLGVLPDLVQDLLADLTDVVRDRTIVALDPASLANEAGLKAGPAARSLATAYLARKSDQKQVSNTEVQRVSEVLWRRLQVLMSSEMPAVCRKVYSLEGVLRLKSIGREGTLLDEALKVIGERPSLLFWKTLAESLSENINRAMQESALCRRVVADEYPRLLDLIANFFSKVAVLADVSYTWERQSPETVMVMNQLRPLSKDYVAKAAARWQDASATAFATRGVPNSAHGRDFASSVIRELQAVRDPFLLIAILPAAEQALQGFFHDLQASRSKTALNLGNGQVPTAQIRDGDLASAAQAVVNGLREAESTSGTQLLAFLQKQRASLETQLAEAFLRPFIQAVEEQLAAPLARMQYHPETMSSSSPSPFMTDLADRVMCLRDYLLPKYQMSLRRDAWALDLVDSILSRFCDGIDSAPNATLVKASTRFSADRAELEFATAQLLASGRSTSADISSCRTYPRWKALVGT